MLKLPNVTGADKIFKDSPEDGQVYTSRGPRDIPADQTVVKVTTTTVAGNPSGTFSIGDLVVNSGDNRIYAWTTVSVTTPDALWLKLEDNGTDSSGAGNTGTLSGGAYATGKYGQGYSFDGDDAKITISDDVDFKIDDNFTLMFWAKMDNVGAGPFYVCHREDNLSDYFRCYWFGAHGFLFEIKGTTGTNNVRTTDEGIGTGEWHHVAVVGNHTAGLIHIYLDGELRDTQTLVQKPVWAGGDDDLIFGEDASAAQEFEGDLDDIKFFKSARTQGEIRNDMLDSDSTNEIWTYVPLQAT